MLRLDPFTWPACGFRTTLGPCLAVGAGLGSRCPAHGGVTVPWSCGRLVLAAQLRTGFDEGVPLGPARVLVVPQKIWTELAPDHEWPVRERHLDGSRKRQRGHRQPIALEPGRGNWPQVVSGDIARRLCAKGLVARVVATTAWLDGWWLRELLGADGEARIELRFPDTSDPTLVGELERRARADHRRAVELGWARWT